MGNVLQSNPPYAPFARMLVNALLRAWLFSLIAFFVTVEIGAIATRSELISVMALMAPTAWMVIGIVAILVGFAIMAPMAALLAWLPYKRGVRSYAVYITLGAVVGFLTLIVLSLIVGSHTLGGGIEGLLAFEWLVASGAFGGWSFAHQLNQSTLPMPQ